MPLIGIEAGGAARVRLSSQAKFESGLPGMRNSLSLLEYHPVPTFGWADTANHFIGLELSHLLLYSALGDL